MSARYLMTSNNSYLRFQLDYIFYIELLTIRAQTKLLHFGIRALRGIFGPLWSQKLKNAFHQFHLISL